MPVIKLFKINEISQRNITQKAKILYTKFWKRKQIFRSKELKILILQGQVRLQFFILRFLLPSKKSYFKTFFLKKQQLAF